MARGEQALRRENLPSAGTATVLADHEHIASGDREPAVVHDISRSRWSIAKDAFFVLGFAALITIPGLGTIAGVRAGPDVFENRAKAELPAKTQKFEAALKGFERYYNDHFGFRNLFVLSNKALRYFVLDTSSSDAVVPGQDGRYFYRQRPSLAELRNSAPFTPAELRSWAKAIEKRWQLSRDAGVPYVFVIAPDAKSIFPEDLPAWMPPQLPQSRIDQLYDYLRDHTPVPYIDLRPALLEAKRIDRRIWYRTDTHWTDLGGYYAYRELLAGLARLLPARAESFRPMELSELKLEPDVFSGDLATLLGLSSLIHEQTIKLTPQRVWEASIVDRPIDEKNFTTVNPHRPHAPRLLFYRDSFAKAFQGAFADHFSFTRFRWSYDFEPHFLRSDKPDIVVQLMVERMLYARRPRALQSGLLPGIARASRGAGGE